jgi:hypothetical protein
MDPMPLEARSAPTFAEHADQWGESGYVYWDGLVRGYFIDRKEQTDGLTNRWTLEAFVADTSVGEAAKAWARELG